MPALLVAATVLVGCGGSDDSGQFSNQATGDFPAEITKAVFQPKQTISNTTNLLLSVKNTGEETIPALALTVNTLGEESLLPFAYHDKQVGLASPQRPIWVLEQGYPKLIGTTGDGGTATSNRLTRNFGELAPGDTANTIWKLVPVKPGAYRVEFTVAAGLSGEANAEDANGDTPRVVLPAVISARPELTQVDKDGNVVPYDESTAFQSGN